MNGQQQQHAKPVVLLAIVAVIAWVMIAFTTGMLAAIAGFVGHPLTLWLYLLGLAFLAWPVVLFFGRTRRLVLVTSTLVSGCWALLNLATVVLYPGDTRGTLGTVLIVVPAIAATITTLVMLRSVGRVSRA